MKEISESQVEARLVSKVKKLGGWAIKLLPFEISGLPDRLVLYQGKAHFVELKRRGKTPRKLQFIIHRKLAKVGFPVHVVDSYADVSLFVEVYLKETELI